MKKSLLILLLVAGCEIRPLDPDTGKAIIEDIPQTFDAISFVEEHWDSRIVPSVMNEAIDLKTLLNELDEDRETASARHGHREGTRPYNFMVRGGGRVIAADTSSRMGFLSLDLPPYDNTADISLQIGPVIRGTSLRDALPFITFNQFINQLEYANVSNALHQRLFETVLRTIDPETLLSNEITFHGVFTLRNAGTPLITPVVLRMEGDE